jgi:hypothetical protein
MNTRGLMGIIVLNIGLDLGVISTALFSMMIIMALVTTVMATPLLEWIYPAEAMARDLVESLDAAERASRRDGSSSACRTRRGARPARGGGQPGARGERAALRPPPDADR